MLKLEGNFDQDFSLEKLIKNKLLLVVYFNKMLIFTFVQMIYKLI